jgi:four helix bundle protein
MPSDFERLTAYRLAAELGDDVWRVVGEWPALAQWTLGRQVIRAADSVAANIAEGVGRRSLPDRRHFYRIARGSLYETEHWLARARQRGLTTAGLATDDLSRCLNGLIRRPGPS